MYPAGVDIVLIDRTHFGLRGAGGFRVQRLGRRAVGVEYRGFDPDLGIVGRADHNGACAVAEQDGDVATVVGSVDAFAQHFGAYYQNVLIGAGFDEVIGDRHSVYETRALLLDVEHRDRGQPEFALQKETGARVGVVGRDGVHYDQIDLIHFETRIGHGGAAGEDGQVRSADVGLGVAARTHAGARDNEFVACLHHFHDVEVGHDFFGHVVTCAYDA
jgi:hypothetical protein